MYLTTASIRANKQNVLLPFQKAAIRRYLETQSTGVLRETRDGLKYQKRDVVETCVLWEATKILLERCPTPPPMTQRQCCVLL